MTSPCSFLTYDTASPGLDLYSLHFRLLVYGVTTDDIKSRPSDDITIPSTKYTDNWTDFIKKEGKFADSDMYRLWV